MEGKTVDQHPITTKTCGNCVYGDYYKRKCCVIKTHVECEVYSRKYERQQKACHNWKEKKNEIHA